MKGFDNTGYLILYTISNIAALLMVWAAWKRPRLARLLLFLLFAWASWTNWETAVKTPQFYLDYANLSFSGLYREFIRGWFSRHIGAAVGLIASCQALISVSMLWKGWLFKVGAAGAIIFLLGILPLGMGSAFPCSLIMAIAIGLLLRKKQTGYLWDRSSL